MGEERTLGFARALESEDEEPSKEELQLRMEETRDSITQTVTEIKESVVQQYETVKDALDWREHFKKQPLAWSLGAAGVGFCVGYSIASALKDEEDVVASAKRSYVSQPILGESYESTRSSSVPQTHDEKTEGPGLVQRFKETRAFDRLQQEVGSLGDRLIDELSTTAQTVILPALIRKVRELIGADLSNKNQSRASTAGSSDPSGGARYQPVLERNPS